MRKLYESVLSTGFLADIIDMTGLRSPGTCEVTVDGVATIVVEYFDGTDFVTFFTTSVTASVALPMADQIRVRVTAGTSTTSRFAIYQADQSLVPVGAKTDPLTGGIRESVNGLSASRGVDTVRSNRVVLFGSSSTAHNESDPVANIWKMTHGYFNWANALLGGRFTVVKNAGIAGNTMTQMLARIDADVLAYEPGWVFFQTGNDVFGNGTSDEITAGEAFSLAVKIIEKIKSVGANVHVLLPWPRGSSNATVNATTLVEHYKFVTMIKQYARTQYGVIATDANEVIVDYTSVTGDALADMLQTDATHLTSKSAQVIGYAVARNVDKAVPYVPWRVGSKAETYGSNASMPCLNDNPNMTGTNPSGNGGGSSGTVIFGASAGRVHGTTLTAVHSVVDCSAIPYPSNSLIPPCTIGKAQKAVISAAAASDRWALTIPLTAARFAQGDVVEARAGLVVRSAVNLRNVMLYLSFNGATVNLADLYRQSTTHSLAANPIDKVFALTDFHIEFSTIQKLVSDIVSPSVTDVLLIVAAAFEATGSADIYVYQPVPAKVLSA